MVMVRQTASRPGIGRLSAVLLQTGCQRQTRELRPKSRTARRSELAAFSRRKSAFSVRKDGLAEDWTRREGSTGVPAGGQRQDQGDSTPVQQLSGRDGGKGTTGRRTAYSGWAILKPSMTLALRKHGQSSLPKLLPKLGPPLKWAGGKRWQVPHLKPFWELHSHRRLVEPFCGGLAVTLGLVPQRALLNDANPHLINFYRWLKRGLRVELDLRNDKDLFYQHRVRFNELLRKGRSTSREAASLFYFLNRTGFNGLCRFNGKGEFNVPFGRYNQIGYVRDFSAYRDVFRRWQFTRVDFESVPLRSEDFVYADPPYDVEFTQYAQGGFSWSDQERTASWLACHPGPVVLVNQATDRIRRLYASLGFKLTELEAPRRINCNGDRTPAMEIFATRNL